ncbi:Kinesin-like protein KIF3A (Microtubule plus end-directed kinesin motor 3A) [Durusdinium trenchii]|uniref:Kinesin-like protein n=1 Tax=Durusdinium trenchii TaxID=1381693 RepID=A0ABP0Q9Y2_9DINO
MDGYNGTIFAYGQTGTGKTHTMVGPAHPEAEEEKGVIPRAFGHVFRNVDVGGNKTFLVRASYMEIYNEEIRDLLSKNPKQKLELKDHPDGGVYVKDLTVMIVKGVRDLQQVMEVGQKNRSVASTLMNNESSRSHSIFTVTVEILEKGLDGQDHVRVGKMNMVDLAGSERQSKTGATGDTLKEATKINMSLSALGNVISALVDAKTSFIPYRDSKLTRLLQDSLGGNTKTVMCTCIGPVDYNYDETMSTLRYAHRAKSIKNKPRTINEDPKDAMIREFQDEITRLKMQLEKRGGPGSPPRAPPMEGEEVVVETEVVEVEKTLGPMGSESSTGRIVEKEVLVEKVVNSGMTDEDVRRLQMQVEQERAEVEEQLNLERQAIEAQKDMAEQEKQQLLEALEEKRRQREQEAQQQEKMLQQLKAMEEKMLVGSQVMEKAMQCFGKQPSGVFGIEKAFFRQEADLRRAAMEVEEKKREEQRMQEELEQQQEEKLELEEKYASTEEQVQKMTAKLEKLWHRHKQTQQEVQDLQHEFQSEREDMLDTIRDLRKEVKLLGYEQLVCLTIENFIPMEQYQQIEQRAHFDESSDEWVISNIDLAGNRVRRRGRLLDESPKGMGRRTNGEGSPDPVAMMNERPNVYFAYTEDGGAQRAETRPQPQKNGKQQRVKSAGRPGTASRKGRGVKQVLGANFLHSPDPIEDENDAAFPKARGLVRAAARSRRARDGVGSAVMTLGVQKTIQKTSAGGSARVGKTGEWAAGAH